MPLQEVERNLHADRALSFLEGQVRAPRVFGRARDDAKRLIYIGETTLCGKGRDRPVRVTPGLLRAAPKRGGWKHFASKWCAEMAGQKIRSKM
ncbi:hypothetical protein DMX10_15230 [Pseudomonas sp. 57B-090624]|nr:hypothetical protein DMX10_15230 [Pseudomonas sp. 57B-090624]